MKNTRRPPLYWQEDSEAAMDFMVWFMDTKYHEPDKRNQDDVTTWFIFKAAYGLGLKEGRVGCP